MNTLSWILYVAEFADRLRTALTGGVLLVSAMAAIIAGISLMWSADRSSYDSDDVMAAKQAWPAKVVAFWKRLAIVASLLFAVGLALPSRSTVVMIAASEIGETLLSSKEAEGIGGEAGALASDSLKLLRKYVTEQLEGGGK